MSLPHGKVPHSLAFAAEWEYDWGRGQKTLAVS